MIDLQVMARGRVALLCALILCWLLLSAAQDEDEPAIAYPKSGDALQGVVTIIGSTEVEDFQSAEVAYAFANGENQTWFLIQQSRIAVKNSALAIWDTSAITDGTYTLRLLVRRKDGSVIENLVTQLRVRNYTPIETNTPEPTRRSLTIQPTAENTPTRIIYPTPTRLPPNPLEITPAHLIKSMAKGTLAVALVFALLGIYRLMQRARKRRRR